MKWLPRLMIRFHDVASMVPEAELKFHDAAARRWARTMEDPMALRRMMFGALALFWLAFGALIWWAVR